jgi:hypothetical protein
MSSLVPTTDAKQIWTGQPDPGIGGTDTNDIVHVIGPTGTVESWLDYTGTPGGNWAIPGPTGPAGAAGNLSDGGDVGGDVAFIGPNPYIDATLYGVRAISADDTIPQTTATASANSTSVSLAAASTFKNGDGVVLYEAGQSCVLATPSALAVTPSLPAGVMGVRRVVSGPSGSTTYSYQIVGRDKLGGLTAAGVLESTNTGAGSLGLNSVSISTITRSNNTVTVTTSSAHGLAVGAIAYIVEVADSSYIGYFRVATVPDNTHFTYTQGMDTRAGASTSSSGGSVKWYNCNYLSWTGDSNTWQYYIYGRASGSTALIGVTRPPLTVNGTAETTWEDYGSTMMGNFSLPDFVPSTPPAASQPQYLATTIVSGAGTTNIEIANEVVNAISSQTIKFCNGPNLVTAAAAAQANGVSGTLHLPAASNAYYYINSHTVLSVENIIQAAPLHLYETLEANVGTWSGEQGGSLTSTPQFAWRGSILNNILTANPGVYVYGGSNVFKTLTFEGKNQGVAVMVADNDTFNLTFENVNIVTGSSSEDYTGICLLVSSISNQSFKNCLFSGSSPNTGGATLAPLFLEMYAGSGGDYPGNIYLTECYFNLRGFALDGAAITNIIRATDCYIQGAVQPVMMFSNSSVVLRVQGFNSDTFSSGAALIANWSSTLGAATIEEVPTGNLVTGSLIPGLNVTTESGGSSTILSCQNRDVFVKTTNSMSIPVYSPGANLASTPGGFFPSSADNIMAAPLHFPSQHSLFWDGPVPTGVSTSVGAGGAVPVDSWNYYVAGIGYDGGQTALSAVATATTTAGNQTVTVSWTKIPSAVAYNVYRISQTTHGGGLVHGGSNITGNSYIDSSAFLDLDGTPTDSGSGVPSLQPGLAVLPNVQLVPVLFANLPSVSDGMLIYCSDCNPGSSPCTGSSTGAIAKGLNGSWVC